VQSSKDSDIHHKNRNNPIYQGRLRATLGL